MFLLGTGWPNIYYLKAVFKFAESNQAFQSGVTINQALRQPTQNSTSLDQVMQQLTQTLAQQEQDMINSGIDQLIADMQDNSNLLLEDAFNTVTTLASTTGQINHLQEQGHFSCLLGSLTGANSQQQNEINQGLNLAIYASQQLIQKLNHKQMLSMEAMVSLANKTSYLMTHVNLLYGEVQCTNQRHQQSLLLMQQGIQAFAQTCWQQFEQHGERLQQLERSQLINNWYHQAKASLKKDNAYQSLLDITASFYLQTGRDWTNDELFRYLNVLDDLELKNQPLVAGTLILSSENSTALEQIGRQHIFPVEPSRQHFHPLLKGMQILSETSSHADNICTGIEQATQLSLAVERPAVELGLELLHSWRCNDRRPPLKHISTQPLTEHPASLAQTQLLSAIAQLDTINDTLIHAQGTHQDLAYLQQKITEFKVVIPIIGKFSSGKSTLLNHYLGKNYLKTDITPETAFATELCYAENEHILIHSLSDNPPVHAPLEALNDLQANDDLAFVQVFLNNAKLQNRPDIVLVDMPGFDARNAAHHKAIASYLARGDFFISLMPIDTPFDASIIERLAEIHLDYGKSVCCLLSKAGRKPVRQREEIQQQLLKILVDSLGTEVAVGLIETLDKHAQTLKDFDNQLDSAARRFDSLLLDRYQPQVISIIKHFDNAIRQNMRFANSSETEVKQQISQVEQYFRQQSTALNNDIAQFENRLCHLGKEKLIQNANEALTGAISQLVNAAKSQQLNNTITEILRPIVQIELDQLIQTELDNLEAKLDKLSPSSLQLLPITLQISPEQKEQFSLQSAVLAAGVSVLIFGPLGTVVTSLISGFLGRKDNSEEREEQIKQQIQNQVIPQVSSQLIKHISQQLNQVARQLKQQLQQSFQQQHEAHQLTIADLQAEQTGKREEHTAKLEEYQQALDALELIKKLPA